MKISRPQITHRLRLAAAATACALLVPGCLANKLGGAFTHRPEEMKTGLSPAARRLVERAFEDIDPARLVDYHCHALGLGTGGTGNTVNAAMHSWRHPVEHFKLVLYLSASGVRDEADVDRAYADRLASLIRNMEPHGHHCLLAFDRNYNPDGTVNDLKTQFYVSNKYVFALADVRPDCFIPVMSVHPYRADALEELERWAQRGGRIVKWLPDYQGMDPADPRCVPFYDKMKALGLILLTHTGREEAVGATEDQELGNPLRLRAPLDRGVRVIAAHCACLGSCEDLEAPGRKPIPAFDLFLRLMGEKKYEGLLFGEISAMTQCNRAGYPLITLLKRADLHPRLVNGSDYPLPAVNTLIRTRSLAIAGYITEEERGRLNEIYDYNPLLFDFVLKRTIRCPDSGERFSSAVFMENPGLR